jgi:hypothetical protein
MKMPIIVLTTVTSFLLGSVAVMGAATAHDEKKGAAEQEDVIGENEIYGGNLMTMEERRALHMKYCSAKNEGERNRMFWEHGKLMQERATQKGVAIPKANQKNWIRHTCPSMNVTHGKLEDAGHHGKRHNMKDVVPETDKSEKTQ